HLPPEADCLPPGGPNGVLRNPRRRDGGMSEPSRERDAMDAAGGRFLDGFRERHAPGTVGEAIAALHRLKVLVVGEAIVDEYSHCLPLGKTPKDAAISARHVALQRHAGGALAFRYPLAGVRRRGAPPHAPCPPR